LAEKDIWDKVEVVGKIAVGLVVPVTIAIVAYLLNDQISQRARSAEMTRIAIGVLQQEPEESAALSGADPLRDWAINVLRDPSSDHNLNEEAAAALRLKRLVGFSLFDGDKFGFGEFNSSSE
jgi:hypothetical protein